jgi:hypothetical protein
MALKVVPAGDERCDIHNGRKPPAYICKDCLKELGVEAGPTVAVRSGQVRRLQRILRGGPFRAARRAMRRSGLGRRPRLLAGAGVVLLIAVIALIVVLSSGGGGGGTPSGPPSQDEVVQALGLSPDPNGNGWITLDGSCTVLSIQTGVPPPTTSANPATTATNEARTVRAVVQNAFSQSQAACVDRISAELRDHF